MSKYRTYNRDNGTAIVIKCESSPSENPPTDSDVVMGEMIDKIEELEKELRECRYVIKKWEDGKMDEVDAFDELCDLLNV